MNQMHMDEDEERKLQALAARLSPNGPIRTSELLKGRDAKLADLVRELTYFQPIPFIFGDRGVGKTSLARTAAQLVTASDREHVYVALADGVRLLSVLRDVSDGLLRIALRNKDIKTVLARTEVTAGLSPSVKMMFEAKIPQVEDFADVTDAVRVIRDLDAVLTDAQRTVVVVDELEVLHPDDRSALAYLVKQIGDQNVRTKFVLVGIAENVSQLLGAHLSAKRYIKEVSLDPLLPQVLMDIVSEAAAAVDVEVDQDVLFRIAIIGNGYPHFAHLMGKALLVEAVVQKATSVTPEIFERGVNQAVQDSIEELRAVYNAATRRGDDVYKHLVWALADKDVVDVRIDEWIESYRVLTQQKLSAKPPVVEESVLRNAIGRLSRTDYGAIVTNMPKSYGSAEIIHRYKRFAETLMRGHVRLQAAKERIFLGRMPF